MSMGFWMRREKLSWFIAIMAIIACTMLSCSDSGTTTVQSVSCTHSWDWVITKVPTATEEGVETYKCLLCGQTGTTRPVSAVANVISAVSINITAPVNGVTPNNTATTDDSGYTVGNVLWTPTDNPFLGGKEYTAIVSLTAKSGYTFTGLFSANINGQNGIILNNTGISASVSYIFPTTPTKTVTNITIKTQPNSLTYTHYQPLDLTGLVVTLTYDDSTMEDVIADNFGNKGITTNPSHNDNLIHLIDNGKPVTITYNSFTPLTTNNLIVNPKVITFTVDPISVYVYNGNAYTPSVTVKDGTNILSIVDDYTVVYNNNTNAGTATVNITGVGNYTGSSGNATFTINSIPIKNVEINITAPVNGVMPNTSASGIGNFTIGEVLWSPSHKPFLGNTIYTASVTLTANNNYNFSEISTPKINGQTASVSNKTSTTATLSYTFSETSAKVVTNIVIKFQPTKLNYIHGDSLDLTGLVVTLIYDDHTTEDVIATNFINKHINANPAHGSNLGHSTQNGQPITITYGNLTPLNTNNLTVNSKAITFTIDAISTQTYTGNAISPTVTVRDGINVLTNSYYNTSYVNNINAGTATVNVTGIGDYSSSTGSKTFTINPKIITFNIDTITAQTYTGNTITPTVTVRDGVNVLTSSNYNISYANNTNAGTATVNVSGVGNYFGSLGSVNFVINKANGAIVSAPVMASKTFNSITIDPVTAPSNGQTVEYARNTSNTTPTSGWQTELTFEGLSAGTTYYIFARSASNNNYNAGTAVSTEITTLNQQGFTITFDAIIDAAPIIVNQTISRTGANKTVTLTVSNPAQYSSIEWHVTGTNVNGSGNSFTLDSSNPAYNRIGEQFLTIEVWKDGKPYNKTIIFTVTQ